jgi:hypothetical protein
LGTSYLRTIHNTVWHTLLGYKPIRTILRQLYIALKNTFVHNSRHRRWRAACNLALVSYATVHNTTNSRWRKRQTSVSGGTPFTIFPQCGYDGISSQYNLFIRYEPAFADTYDAIWQEESFDLSPWAGQTVQVLFDFGSSSRTRDAGWYINRVGVYSIMPTEICEPFASQKAPRKNEISVSPNPFNASCEIDLSSFTDTPQNLEIL